MFPKPSLTLKQLIGQFGHERASADRMAVLEQMGRCREIALLPYLEGLIHHPDHQIRTLAESIAGHLMEFLSPQSILELEAEVRYDWETHRKDAAFRSVTPAGLKLSTISPNGWRRERALLDLAKRDDLSALPFVLPRLNDWVDPVRRTALAWVKKNRQRFSVEDLAKVLPILAALTQRYRSSEQTILKELLQCLENPDSVPFLLLEMRKANAITRRCIMGILFKTGAFDERPMQQQFLQAKDPVWGLLLLKHLTTNRKPLPASVIELGIAAKSSIVRAHTFFNIAPSQLDHFEPQLWGALMDSQKGVRELAQYQLRSRYPESLICDWYGAKIQDPSISFIELSIAIMGFHEVGGRLPEASYLDFQSHVSPCVRQAACFCFVSKNPVAAAPLLKGHVQNPLSGKLGTSSTKVLQKMPSLVELGEMRAWLVVTQPTIVRKRAFSILRKKGKWEMLPFLLELSYDEDHLMKQSAQMQLGVWLARFNFSQVQPTVGSLEEAKNAFNKAKTHLAVGFAREFASLLKSFER